MYCRPAVELVDAAQQQHRTQGSGHVCGTGAEERGAPPQLSVARVRSELVTSREGLYSLQLYLSPECYFCGLILCILLQYEI